MTRAYHSSERKASATAGLERELKFVADPKTFDAALALPLLGGPDGRASRRLESVYFDTEDDDLARSGVTLRVRREDGACIQGLKRAADSDRGMFERDEQEVESPSAEPDLALFGAETARDLAEIVGGKVLEAKFGSDVRRTTRTVQVGGAAVEVALDSGFLFAGERREPLREIELELKSGAARGAVRLRSSGNRGASAPALRREQGRARTAPPVASRRRRRSARIPRR